MDNEKMNGKKESKLKKLWDKTIFPDLIEKKRKRREFEKKRQEEYDKLRIEAITESREEIKSAIKEDIIKREVERLKEMTPEAKAEKRKEKLKKFADAFTMKETSIGSTDKINELLGNKTNSIGNSEQNINNTFGLSNSTAGVGSNEKINQMLGINTSVPEKRSRTVRRVLNRVNVSDTKKEQESYEERLKRLLE